MSGRTQVNLRLDVDLLAALDELGRYEHLDRPELTRRILREGVARHREERAIQEYGDGRVSAWRAAEMAGVSLYDMLDLIHQRGIVHDMDPQELEQIRRLPVPSGGTPGGTEIEREHRRIAEAVSPPYVSDRMASPVPDAESGIQRLRDRYRPSVVRTLMVGESSPASGTHFYLANSNLFRAVREAFVVAQGDAVPSGEAFLAYFADAGYWLVDVADEPVNRMSDAVRRQTVEAGATSLRATIEQTRPDAIVAVKATVGEIVRHAAQAAGSAAAVDVLPFPVRQWRAVFVKGLATLIDGPVATGAKSQQRPTTATVSAAAEAVLTQRVTQADLRRGQIRIPSTGRGKSFFPAVRGRINVVLRGQQFDASYDPHYDPDQQRSGVIRIGRKLASLVEAEEKLNIGRGTDGGVTLD